MKKAKSLLLALLAGFVLVGVGGCANSAPCDINIQNAKTTFEVGEEFSLAEDMKVILEFENNQTTTLENPANFAFLHDEEEKTYTGFNYVIDYSNYNAHVGGVYQIMVTYIDHDKDPNNLICKYFSVTVERMQNDWVTYPTISNWTFGESPTLAFGQVVNQNAAAQYSYKFKSSISFGAVCTQADIISVLSGLAVGEYDLKVYYPQTDMFKSLEMILSFSVEQPGNIIP